MHGRFQTVELLQWMLELLAQDLSNSNSQAVAHQTCPRQIGALQQMALRTTMQTSWNGMMLTPIRCGKVLLLQSTARAPPLQLMHCQHWSSKQLLQPLENAGWRTQRKCRQPLPGAMTLTPLCKATVEAIGREMLQSTLLAKRLCRPMQATHWLVRRRCMRIHLLRCRRR